MPPCRHRSAAVTLRGTNVCADWHPHALRAPPKKASKEGQEKSLAESCQKYTKETFHKSKAQRHEMCESQTSITWRMYFCKICDGVKLKKKEKNATLAVHSHLSCRAWEPAQCLFDFPRGTLWSKWDSMTDICIPEDKVLGILLIGVEQTLCQRVSYCIIVCTLRRHLTEFHCLTGCEWEPAAISSVAKGHINC